jgi:HJR/Mrr/RecB family endonuclease
MFWETMYHIYHNNTRDLLHKNFVISPGHRYRKENEQMSVFSSIVFLKDHQSTSLEHIAKMGIPH